MQPKSIAKVNELMKSLKDKELQDYLVFNYVSSAANYLSDDFIRADFDMFSKTLSGKNYVQVYKVGVKTEVDIETGISNATEIQITSGLSEGDEVVVK